MNTSLHQRAFTLIEMLIATALVGVLMGGVVSLLGGVSRDVKTLQKQARSDFAGVVALLHRDLTNADRFVQSDDGRVIEMTGSIGIDRRSYAFDGRLARVRYRLDSNRALRREQIYVDAPERPEPWSETAAFEVDAMLLVASSGDAAQVRIQSGSRTFVHDLRLH